MTEKDIERIREQYVKEIKIPAGKPKEQIFFCPVGLVGAGKTTFTKPIAEKLGLVRISSDEIRKLLKEGGFGYEHLKEILWPVIEKFAEEGYGIAFDMDCGNPETKEFIEKAAAESSAKIRWVHIDSPEDYIFEKFRKHPPTWLADDPQTMIDNYQAQKEKRAKENTEFHFDWVFDASKDVQKQIEDFLRRVRTQ